MGIDVQQVADQVLAAFKQELGAAFSQDAPQAKAAAEGLAQSLADIAAARALGQLNDVQAKALMQGAADDAAVQLGALAIQAEAQTGQAVIAGLKVLEGVALGAAGLGWAQPILDQVISNVAANAG